MSTFVLVHGAWHASWCWEKVVPHLEEAGHRVTTLSAHGSGGDDTPVSEGTLVAYAECVAAVLDEQPKPVILVGHGLPCEKVVSIESSHSPFLCAQEELVEHLGFLARL